MDVAPLPAVSPAPESEAGLVARARRGDEAAIRRLIKANNQRLFRVARSVMRDDAEAEDVVQAAYVAAFTALASFREDARFSTWLTRIALNEALGRLRRRRPQAGLEALDAAVEADAGWTARFPLSLMPLAADSEVGRSEMRHLIESAIDALPEPFRIVFVLREVEGMSLADIAAQLDLRPETVKTRLHRARKHLRAGLEERIKGTFSEAFPFDGWRCDRMADSVVAALRIRTEAVDPKPPNR
ncbi:RNA polymerase sigma factor [Devosia sp.]|uniref:RNA polymerase sigma factor n=1 Tax=Devosia sp. TaxID=1871048 RepID=UPI002AFE7F76|nr:RNA polymerase sigma factor [Devosia sp.]